MRTNPLRSCESKRSPLWRAVSAVALSGLLLAGTGCDTFDSDQAKADKKVAASLKKSVATRRQPSVKNLDAVVTDLTGALKEKDATESRKIAARSLLAETQFELGDKVTIDLIPVESRIADLIWQVGQLGASIHAVNLEVESLSKSEPTPTIEEIAKKRTTLEAEAKAAATKAGEIQAQITAAQGKIAELVQQQQALRTQADADRIKASKLTGKEQVAALDAVTETMRKAENVGHEIFKVSGALTPATDAGGDKPWEDPKNKPLIPFQQDLATENEKKAQAEKTIAGLAVTEKTVTDAWAGVKAQMEERKKAAATLGEQLAKTADELTKVEKEAADLREKAMTYYKAAETAWAATAGDAAKLGNRLKSWSTDVKYAGLPEAKAWKNLAETYNHHFFKLLQGRALDRIGSRQAAAAAIQDAKAQVSQKIAGALKAANITPPASLAAAASTAEKSAATAAYDASLALYTDIFQYGLNPAVLKDSAKLSNMFTLYGEYQLTGDAKKLEAARSQYGEIFTTDKIADPKVGNFAKLLPADLAGKI